MKPRFRKELEKNYFLTSNNGGGDGLQAGFVENGVGFVKVLGGNELGVFYLYFLVLEFRF